MTASAPNTVYPPRREPRDPSPESTADALNQGKTGAACLSRGRRVADRNRPAGGRTKPSASGRYFFPDFTLTGAESEIE